MISWGTSRMRKQWIPGHCSGGGSGLGTRLCAPVMSTNSPLNTLSPMREICSFKMRGKKVLIQVFYCVPSLLRMGNHMDLSAI